MMFWFVGLSLIKEGFGDTSNGWVFPGRLVCGVSSVTNKGPFGGIQVPEKCPDTTSLKHTRT